MVAHASLSATCTHHTHFLTRKFCVECFTLKKKALQFFSTLETTHMMTQRRVTEGLNL